MLKKEVRRGFYKIVKADLDSPRQELSNGGLGFVLALPFFRELIFCVLVRKYWKSNPAAALVHLLPNIGRSSFIVGQFLRERTNIRPPYTPLKHTGFCQYNPNKKQKWTMVYVTALCRVLAQTQELHMYSGTSFDNV